MLTKSEKENIYKKHLEDITDSVSNLSEEEVNKRFNNLLLCIPNDGKLYKYRHFGDENNHFENNYMALSEGYIWLAAPITMNDKVDSTLKIDTQAEFIRIYKFILENKDIILNKWIKTLFNNLGVKLILSDDDIKTIINSYTRQGRVIKTRIRPLLQKYRIPYVKLNSILNQVALFIEKYSVDFEPIAKEIANKFVSVNEEIRDNLRLFCISESPFIDSMWAYYGNNNQGYCIEYDLQKALNYDVNIKRVLLQIFKVEYKKNKQLFSFESLIKKVLLDDNFTEEDKSSINSKIIHQLITKNVDWKHEREWRIIVQSSMNRLNVDLVTGIYIDSVMQENSNASKLIKLARTKGWKIYIRCMNNSQTKFLYKEAP